MSNMPKHGRQKPKAKERTFVVHDANGAHAFWLRDDKTLIGPTGSNPPYEFDTTGSTPVTVLQNLGLGSFGQLVEVAELDAGTYRPRMWRGTIHDTATVPTASQANCVDAFYTGVQQAEILMANLDRLFTVVHPTTQRTVYGSEIRNVLILACTEVEAQWRAVLDANLYGFPDRERFDTGDYVKLAEPMQLNGYIYRLSRFPDFGAIRPFDRWPAAKPTPALPWYAAYHSVKHDREKNFAQATLEHAIYAVAAVDVMLMAQFGMGALNLLQARSSFVAASVPHWRDAQRYYPPPPGKQWTPMPYPF